MSCWVVHRKWVEPFKAFLRLPVNVGKISVEPAACEKIGVCSFVEGWAKFIHNLSIDWYGGEPLLEMDLIKNMSKQFIAICQEKEVQYNSSMVTNGYHLTPQIAKELKELKVENIQITIDGPEDIHNARRILANGRINA